MVLEAVDKVAKTKINSAESLLFVAAAVSVVAPGLGKGVTQPRKGKKEAKRGGRGEKKSMQMRTKREGKGERKSRWKKEPAAAFLQVI